MHVKHESPCMNAKSAPPREVTGSPVARIDVDAVAVDLRVRLSWLLVFRSMFTTALGVTLLVLRTTSPDSFFTRESRPLFAVVVVSFVSIGLGALWLRGGSRGWLREFAIAHLAFDGFVAAVFVGMTGGVESVFVFVFSLTILNGAAVLQKFGARLVAAFVAALYALIFALQSAGVFVPLNYEVAPTWKQVMPAFLTNTASFALVAVLVGYLAEQVKRSNERLDVARAEISRIEKLYAAVLESLPSGVLTIDAASRVVYVNGAGADILGTQAHQLVGSMLDANIPALTASGERFERTAVAGARGLRTIGGSTAALSGLEGFAGRVVVFQDLTELRRLQSDVARAERLTDLGRFAAGLAHEIRNPLAAMIGCLQLLRSDDTTRTALGDDGERMLGIVHREAERLSSLVTDFLVYARPAAPRRENTALRAIAQETLDVLRTTAPDAELTVEGDEVRAICDPDQLRQVLWNLVGNALNAIADHHSDATTRDAAQVRISVQRAGQFALIFIDDNGPGVTPDVRPRIFEPFFTTRASGTGLGLATSHQLVLQNAGVLLVSDSPMHGARFEIRLPLAGEQ